MAFRGSPPKKQGLPYVRAAALGLYGISGHQLTVKTKFIHTEETSRKTLGLHRCNKNISTA